eukprot:gnl/TRDRNA2_/TRDRNA2_45241_c0_seq1.p1 gnl/TRDRNA2_/TRDRNA2_45241_c0~~gnl/TRDRNA2_/TRDRNA2_45241_c0_seq1.p1  ORF type:complete len:237 (-),score=44.12 gnl/TRDRNA2_/TRDRNA2_45241_c0_seq1:84-794(-)
MLSICPCAGKRRLKTRRRWRRRASVSLSPQRPAMGQARSRLQSAMSAKSDSGLPPWWKAAAFSVGAGVALALVLRRLRQSEEEAKASPTDAASRSAGTTSAPVEAKPAASVPSPAASAAPTAPVTGGIEAQRAAAMGSGSAWAPDLDAPTEADIERRLRARFNPSYLEIENQGSCEAIKVGIVMVSDAFNGRARIDRQREVQAIFRPDLNTGRIHALSMRLNTPEEYKKIMEKAAK